MPEVTLDTGDATELSDVLHFLPSWPVTRPAALIAGRRRRQPGYGLTQPREDLERFMFPLGGSDRGPLFGPGATSGSPRVRDY